jgi:hypothetical protein
MIVIYKTKGDYRQNGKIVKTQNTDLAEAGKPKT